MDSIASLVARDGFQPRDFAVMYRTNAQSRLLEEAFLAANLPYKLVGAQRFYGRREVKDLIAYLRLMHNPDDEISLLRIINVPSRGIGNKTVISLRTLAQRAAMAPGELLLELARGPESGHWDALSGRAASVLSNFGELLAKWRRLREEISPLNLMDRILEDVRYRDYIDDGSDEGAERWENVMELRRLAAEYQERGLETFLEDVALISDQDTLDASANVPTLLTLHAAKGLEFPVVFIVGMEDGLLPHSRALEDGEELAEERRLFYVGLTRAKDQVILSHAFRRMTYGGVEVSIPSRFLHDIPATLVEGGSSRQRRRETTRRISSWQWTPPAASPAGQSSQANRRSRTSSGKALPEPNPWSEPAAPEKPASHGKQRYRSGQKVSHKKFGGGIVIESKLTGNDEEVVVAFKEAGIKKLIASIARLELRD